jgi:8-oxo-dGTP diphosphatase
MYRGIIALVFLCVPVGGEVHATDEAESVQWLTGDEVRERMTEVYAARLLDALSDQHGTCAHTMA